MNAPENSPHPATAPVEPIPGYTWNRGSYVPLLFIIPVILIALGVYARFEYGHPSGEPESANAVYVEQQLEPDTPRADEDRTRDEMKERNRDALATDRIDDMASVDLTAPPRPPVSENDFRVTMGQLDSKLDVLETQAKEVGQISAYEALEERHDMLDDLADDIPEPWTPQQVQQLHRELASLRQDIARFESELNDVAEAPR